jgi:hypothetical protein
VSDLDRYTRSQLYVMERDTYRRAMYLYDRCEDLLALLAELVYPSAAYTAAKADNRIARTAAREAHEMHRAVLAELRRREAADA